MGTIYQLNYSSLKFGLRGFIVRNFDYVSFSLLKKFYQQFSVY